MIGEQLDLWPDEVSALPWGGTAPRLLAQEVVTVRLVKHAAAREAGLYDNVRGWHRCVVDNSLVLCPSREALRIDADPAQLMLCICTSFKGVPDGTSI